MDALLETAAREWIARAEESSEPDGNGQTGATWWPNLHELRNCCPTVVATSPSSRSNHYRHVMTYKHLSYLYHVDVRELRAEVARQLLERNLALAGRG